MADRSPNDDFHTILSSFQQELEKNSGKIVERVMEESLAPLSSAHVWNLIEAEILNNEKSGRENVVNEWVHRFPDYKNQLISFLSSRSSPQRQEGSSKDHNLDQTIDSGPIQGIRPRSEQGSSSGSGGSIIIAGGSRPPKPKKIVPGMQFGAYEIMAIIGQGGMGVVYKARDTSSGQIVALKTIHTKAGITEEVTRRFSREARLAAKLEHPNIVRAIDAGEIENRPFMALEYVEGKNLSEIVTESGPLSNLTAVTYLLQAAKGIQHAHHLGIIHRDIKPSNMLLDIATDTVKVLDLGLARMEVMLDDATRSADLTSTGAMFGTVDYMAPEQARDAKRADAGSDIYSLGCTLHYLLTGSSLYPGDSILNKIRQHRDAPIPKLNSINGTIPSVLQATFDRMVAKDPRDRFSKMEEVIESLSLVRNVLMGSQADILSATLKIKAKHKPGKKQSTKSSQRKWNVVTRVLAVLALLVTVSGIYFALARKNIVSAPDTKTGSNPGDQETDAPLESLPTQATVRSLDWDWPEGFPSPLRFPTTADQAQLLQKQWFEHLSSLNMDQQKWKPNQIESEELSFALIPPGEFTRGCQGDIFGLAGTSSLATNFIDSARPPTPVRLTRPFLMSKHEITVAQFQKFIDATGYQTTAEQTPNGGWFYEPSGNPIQNANWNWKFSQAESAPDKSNRPIVFVTRQDADAYCGWLTEQHNHVYRLPTEAEWEFACRAGSDQRFAPFDRPEQLTSIAWADDFYSKPVGNRSAIPTPHPVGTKDANPFGLHDMLGNVWEICLDGVINDSYRFSNWNSQTGNNNPSTPSTLMSIFRGGSIADSWQSSNPYVRIPETRPWAHVGFRIVQELPSIQELEPPALVKLPERGEPLGKRALVSSPPSIPGLRSWSIETVGFRGAIASIDHHHATKLIAASSSSDPVIRIYNEKLQLQRVFVGASGNVSSVSFSPDGKHLAAASWGSDWDNSVRVWEMDSGRLVYHDDTKMWVPRVVWSPDGKYLAYPQTSGTRLVDWKTGTSRFVSGYNDHELCWAPDGKRFAVRDNSYQIRVYSTSTLTRMKQVNLPGAHSTGPMVWSPDGKWFTAVHENGSIKLLDGESFEERHSIIPPHAIANFLWTSDCKRLIATGSQTTVWDVDTQKLVQTIPMNGVADWSVPDQSLIFGRSDGLLEQRPLEGASTSRSPDRGRPLTGSALLSSDGLQLVTRVGSDLMFWNAETGESIDRFANAVDKDSQLSWSPNGQKLAAWMDKKLVIIQRTDGKILSECVGHKAVILNCNWSPDSLRIVSTSDDLSLRCWDASNGTEVASQLFETAPQDAAWSHDGRTLAAIRKGELVFVSSDGKSIMDRQSTPADYAYRGGGSHGLSWSSDDSQLTVGLYHENIYTFSFAEKTWDTLSIAQPAAPFVGAMSWSPDGKHLVASTTYQDALSIDFATATSKPFFPCSAGQWHSDSRRLVCGLFSNLELYGFDTFRHQRTGVLVPALGNATNQSLCIGSEGHVRGPSSAIVYVALAEDGRQLTYRQADFEKQYGWKNDPSKAKFLGSKESLRPLTPVSTSPPLKELAQPVSETKSNVARDPDIDSWLSTGLVSRPVPIDSLRNWTIETSGHRGRVTSLSFHPNGNLIASTSEDGTTRLWDRDCRLIGIWIDAKQPVRSGAWSNEGHWMATISDDRYLRVWDSENGILVKRILLPYQPTAIHWRKGGDSLAVEGKGGTVCVHLAKNQIQEIAAHPDTGIPLCSWSPDGNWLAILIGNDCQLLNGDTLATERRIPLSSLDQQINVVSWTPDNRSLVGVDGVNNTRVRFWDPFNGQVIGETNARCATATSTIQFSRDGKRFLTGNGGRNLYDSTTREAIASLPLIYGVAALSPSGDEIATVLGNSLVLVDAVNGVQLKKADQWGNTGHIPLASISFSGKKLFLIQADSLLSIEPESGRINHFAPFAGWALISASPDGERIAARTESKLCVFRTTDMNSIELKGHQNLIYAMAWSSDGKRLASMDSSKTLIIWDTENGQSLHTFNLPAIFDSTLRWRTGNKELTITSGAGQAIRLDAETGAILEQRTLSNSQKPSLDLSMGDDDRRVSLDAGGVIRVHSKSLNRSLGHWISGISGNHSLCIGPTGHFRTSPFSEAFVRYVTLDAEGKQNTYTPSEFSSRFHWTNNPAEASLAAKRNEPPETTKANPRKEVINGQQLNEKQAAEKVLQLGGILSLRCNGINQRVSSAQQIPADTFEVLEVDLHDTMVTDEDLLPLKKLNTLRSLDLGGCRKITDQALAIVGHQPNQKYLRLCYSSITDDGIQLSGFPQLESLNLEGLPITDRLADQLDHTPKLQNLLLGGTSVSDAIGPKIAKLKSLQSLNLPATVSDETILQLAKLPIHTLYLTGEKITDRSASSLAEMSQLRTLGLSNTLVSDTSIAAVCKHPLQQLTYIGSKLTEKGAFSLSELHQLTKLHLDLSELKDGHLQAISQISDLQNLTLRGNHLNSLDAGESLGRLTNLSQLILHGINVDDATLSKMIASKASYVSLTDCKGITGKAFRQGFGDSIATLILGSGDLQSESLLGVGDLAKIQTLQITGVEISAELSKRIVQLPMLHELQLLGPSLKTNIPFSQANELASLSIGNASDLTSLDYQEIAKAAKLSTLSLHQGVLDPKAWKGLHESKSLKNLNLQECRISQKSLDAFKKKHPETTIAITGGNIE